MSFLKNILQNIKQPETNLSVSIDCRPAPKVLSKGDTFKVLFPPQAAEDNVITLSGGCIARLNVGDFVEDLLGDSFSFYTKVAQKQASEVEKAFTTIINPYDPEVKLSFHDFNKNVRLKINDAIVNRISQTNIRSFPNFHLSSTRVENGVLSYANDKIITNFSEFSDMVNGAETRIENTHSIFKFKFITKEAILKILEKLTTESAAVKEYQVRSWDGSEVSLYHSQFLSILEKEDLGQDLTEADEKVVQSILGYILPIHSVSYQNIDSSIDFETPYAYCTYINKSFYFRFPNLSGNYIDGLTNIWSVGQDPDDDGDIKFDARYLSMEIIVSPTDFLFIPLEYAPPVSPDLESFNQILENDADEYYDLFFKKDGLVGSNPAFGKSAINQMSDYKFVFVPVKDDVYGRVIPGGYSNLKNKEEIVVFPNQSFGSDKAIDLKDIISADKLTEVVTSYFNYLQTYLKLDSFNNLSSFLAAFNSFEKLQDAFGVIPDALGDETLNKYDLIDMQSRYDLLLDSTSSSRTRKIKKNVEKIVKPSTYTDNTMLLSYAPNYVDTDGLNKSLFLTLDSSDKTLLNFEDSAEDETYINLRLNKTALKNIYTMDSGTLFNRNEVSFNLFIVDKYGQYTKVYANGSENLTFSGSEPLSSRIESNNKNTNLAKIKDRFDITIKGKNLEGISKILLKIIETDSDGEVIRPNLDLEFPGQQGVRNGFLIFNKIERKKTKLRLKIEKFIGDLFQDEATFEEGLNVSGRTRYELSLFKGDTLIKSIKTTIETLIPEEDEEISPFESNAIYPKVRGKRFKNIPITNDPDKQPVLRIKSKKGIFDNDIFGYFAIPIDVAGQKEEDILNIISNFEKSDGFIKLTLNDESGNANFPEFKNKTFILCKNFIFSTEFNTLNITGKKKAELFLTRPGMLNENLESLLNIKSAIIFMTNISLENETNDITTSSIITPKANQTSAGSYSILPIGANPMDGDESSAFILPPFIRQISSVRSSKDIFGKNPTLKSNTFLNDTLQAIRKEIQDSDYQLLSGFKSTFGSSQENSSNKGTTLYMSKRSKYFMLVFNSTSDENDLRRNYKISVGNSRFGISNLGGGIPLFRGIVNGFGVFIFKNIKPNVNGFLNINVVAKNRKYRISYDSTLLRKHTIEIKKSNTTINEKTKELVLIDKKISSHSTNNKSLTPLFDYDYIPYFDKFDLPTSEEAKNENNINTVARLTTAVKVFPSTNVEFKAYPAGLSSELNSESADIKNFSDLLDITVSQDGSSDFDLDTFSANQKQKIQESLNQLGNLGENFDIDLTADLEGGLQNLESALNIEINPLSSLTNFLTNIKNVVDDVTSLGQVDNTFVAFNTSFVNAESFSNYFEDSNEHYKAVLTFKYSNYNSVRVKVPRVIGIKRLKNNEITLKQDFPEFELKVGESYELFFEDFNPRFAVIEVNGIEILDKTKTSVIFTLSAENKNLMDLSKNIVSPNNPCQVEINVNTDNSNWSNLREDVSNKFTNILGRDDLIGQYGGTAYEDFLARFSPSSQTQIKKDIIANFCENAPLEFIGDKVCGGGLLNTIKSFCDFSFHATIELSLELKSFKKLLVVIKVIFCIIDVLCALMNPKKLAFALIRLFLCLYDLLLLLPQISIPVMALRLFLHILELLKCIIDKVLGTVRAVNEITTALTQAYKLKNLAAIRNLERVIDKYLLTLELDLAILDPILQILAQFLELLEFVFRFPCRVGAGDDLGVLCLEASNLAGFIAAKVSPNGFIEHKYLMPVAQAYTTISEEDAEACGNTPPKKSFVDDEFRSTLLSKSGSTNCNFNDPVIKRPSSIVGSAIFTKTDEETFNDVVSVVTDESKTFRIVNNEDFEPTYAVSFTKTKKRKFGAGGIIVGPDPRRVEFQFNNRAESFSLGKWLVIKRIIDDAQTLDAPFKLLKEDGNSIKVSDSSEKGEFISFEDGFTDFLKDGKSSVKPLVLKFGTLGEGGFSLTYDTIPSMAIMDDEFNVYFIEEDGITYNSNNEIEKISAVMINKISADTRKFEKEDKEIPKAGEAGDPFREYENYIYIDKLNLWDNDTYTNTTKNLSIFTMTSEQIEGIPYTDDDFDDGVAKATNYLFDEEDEDTVQELYESIEEIKIFNFPNLYFIDLRQFTDEIIQACQVNGITDIFSAMELDAGAGEAISGIIQNQEECTNTFLDFIKENISRIRSDVNNANIDIKGIDESLVKQEYQKLVECTNTNKNNMCTYVINPFNTSFMLIDDNDLTERNDSVDPNDVDLDVLNDAAGDDEFELPTITGAEEYASGIGDNLTLPAGSNAVFEIIPRDSYDATFADDVTDRITINIISDSTGSARVVIDEGQAFERDGDSYFGAITADGPGTVLFTAQICNKTIKAFSYKGITPDEGSEEIVRTSCVTIPESEDTSDTPLGSVIRVDRVLSITFTDNNTSSGNFSSGKSYKDLDNIANSFDAQTSPNVTPQEKGTKLEN